MGLLPCFLLGVGDRLRCMWVPVIKRIVGFDASENRLDLHLRLSIVHDRLVYDSVDVTTWLCEAIHPHNRHFLDSLLVTLLIYCHSHFRVLVGQLEMVPGALLEFVRVKLDVSLGLPDAGLWLHHR